MSPIFDVVVVGGGIAGLSTLNELAQHCRACLLEAEPVLAAHASGRNAAIRRPLEWDQTTASLADRSERLLCRVLERSPLRRTGLLLIDADVTNMQRLQSHALQQKVRHRLCDSTELERLQPVLSRGSAKAGVFVPEGGELDIHAITSGLARSARQQGAQIRTGTRVVELQVARDRVTGVCLADGARLPTQHVVLAAGAWSAGLGAAVGAPLPLQPVRRHLLQLATGAAADAERPVVWRLDDEVYFRPEGGGFLASPCDATPWPAELPAADPGCREQLAARLSRTAPSLAAARVQAHWACLRTFAADGELVAGPDPRIDGLHWLSGLGGRGMSVGPAVGELVAARLAGRDHPLARPLEPARLLRR